MQATRLRISSELLPTYLRRLPTLSDPEFEQETVQLGHHLVQLIQSPSLSELLQSQSPHKQSLQAHVHKFTQQFNHRYFELEQTRQKLLTSRQNTSEIVMQMQGINS